MSAMSGHDFLRPKPKVASAAKSTGVDDPWKLIEVPDASSQVPASVSVLASSSAAPVNAPQVQSSADTGFRGGMKWGELRGKLLRSARAPYSLEARVAARALDVKFHVALRVPQGVDMWSKDSIMSSPWGSLWDVTVPALDADEQTQDAQEDTPMVFDHSKVRSKPWKSSVVRSKAWSDSLDEQRSKVLEIWKALVLSSGHATKVGRDLLKAQDAEASVSRVQQIVRDVFAKKSTNTLKARASSVLQFVRWKVACDLEPAAFPILEELAYEYVTFLREEGAPKTKAPRFREAANFCGALLGFRFSELSSSARLEGACISITFRPVIKCDPLTVLQVQELEARIFDLSDEVACVVGFILYVLHGRLRWSDAQCTESEPQLDKSEDGQGYLIASLYHHKTADKGSLLRHRLLPVSCLSPGVTKHCWASEWLRRRARVGLRAGRGVPLMPRLQAQGGFGQLPMDASQGALFLSEFMCHQAVESDGPQRLRTHSLKCTLLSWMAKAACPEALRSVAGYHVGKSRSTLEYDRDSLAPVVHYLEGLFLLIREGVFAPDSSRAGRWAGSCKSVESALASLEGQEVRVEVPASQEASSDIDVQSEVQSCAEEVASADEFVDDMEAAQGLSSLVDRAEGEPAGKVFRHKVSRMYHVPRVMHPDSEGEASVLVCGRIANSNYELVDLPTICVVKCSGCFA